MDNIKFKVILSDTRNGKVLFSIPTHVIKQSQSFVPFLDRWMDYLYKNPYTKITISPLVSVDSGELFNPNEI